MDIRDMEVIDETLNALQYEVERGNYTKARLYAIGLNEVFEQSDINDCIEARLEEKDNTELGYKSQCSEEDRIKELEGSVHLLQRLAKLHHAVIRRQFEEEGV